MKRGMYVTCRLMPRCNPLMGRGYSYAESHAEGFDKGYHGGDLTLRRLPSAVPP